MLKKLQKKIILINMTLVGTVLLFVFVVLVVSNYRQNADTVENAMRRALQMKTLDNLEFDPLPEIGRQPDLDPKDPFQFDDSFIPTVTVTVDDDMTILIDGMQSATIDETVLTEAVALVIASDEDSGILSDYDLRYMRSLPPKVTHNSDYLLRIVFADRNFELANMQQLVITSLLIGTVSLVALFFISYGLSKLALRPVQKAWQQQRQFVADASHELKTPLTVILANTGILQSHPSDSIASQKQWVDSTKAEGERMKQLIDDMLYLAKSDADHIPAILSRIDLSDILWSCLLPFEAVAYERGLTLNTEIASDVFVDGDGSAIKQLLTILLDNACKYSGARGTITVSLESIGTAAALTVHNTGEPIPPQSLPHIFERFYRADASRVREEGGYGLGLSIAKTIADAHDATLSVFSNAEEGTAFSFIIPLSREMD